MKINLQKSIKSFNAQEMNFAIDKEKTIPFTCKIAILEGLANNKDLSFPKAKLGYEILETLKKSDELEIKFTDEEGFLIFESVYKSFGLHVVGQVCFEQ